MRTRNARRKSIQWGRTVPYSHFGGQIRQSKTDSVRLASGAVRRQIGVSGLGGAVETIYFVHVPSARTEDVRVRMQDLQPMTGRRLFEAAVERRLGPLIHQQYHLHHQSHHQVLKCPRCDSVDTKFCYYNNYNLSQPRHFCKSCRRYWTRGGVLRNVPVGGGCRKNKRSKAKQSPPDTTAAPAEFRTDASSPPLKLPEQKSSSHSSSESSTLTAATTATATATEAASGATPFASFSSGGGLLNIRSREPLVIPTPDPNPAGLYMRTLPRYGVETGALSEVGNLAGLVTASASAEPIPPGLEINDVPLGQQPVHATRQQHQWQNQDWSQTLGNLFNQTVQVDLYRMASGLSSGGFGPSDWGGKSEGGFDLPTTVDQAYWRQDLGQWAEPYQGQHPERSPYLP